MGGAIPQKERTLTMGAAIIYCSGHWLRGISDLVSLVHFGRSGGRDHSAPCCGTISGKERTLNDGRYDSPEGAHPNDESGHYLLQRPLVSPNVRPSLLGTTICSLVCGLGVYFSFPGIGRWVGRSVDHHTSMAPEAPQTHNF